jgi:hypothetical protein
MVFTHLARLPLSPSLICRDHKFQASLVRLLTQTLFHVKVPTPEVTIGFHLRGGGLR